MALSFKFENEGDKTQLVCGLAALLVADANNGDITADAVNAAITASGNQVGAGLADMYATVVTKAEGGIADFCPAPGSGGGGGGGGAAAAGPAAAAEPEKPKEEEVDPMEGGMNMFGADAASDY